MRRLFGGRFWWALPAGGVLLAGALAWYLIRPPLGPRDLPGHSGDIFRVALSYDGRVGASGGSRELIVWDLPREKILSVIPTPVGVWGLALTPDGKNVLYGGIIRTAERGSTHDHPHVDLCEAKSGNLIRRFEFPNRPTHQIGDVAVDDEGRMALVACGSDVALLDLSTGQVVRTFALGYGTILCVALSNDGWLGLAGTNRDPRVAILDFKKRKVLRPFDEHEKGIWRVAISRDGNRAVSTEEGGTLRVWDIPTRKGIRTFPRNGRWVNHISFLGEGRFVLLSEDGILKAFDTITGAEKALLTEPRARTYAVSGNGKWLLAAGFDKVVRLRPLPASFD